LQPEGLFHEVPLPVAQYFGRRENAAQARRHRHFAGDNDAGNFRQDRGIALDQDGPIGTDRRGPLMQLRFGVFIGRDSLLGGDVVTVLPAKNTVIADILAGTPEIQNLLSRPPSRPHVAAAHACAHQFVLRIVVVERQRLAG